MVVFQVGRTGGVKREVGARGGSWERGSGSNRTRRCGEDMSGRASRATKPHVVDRPPSDSLAPSCRHRCHCRCRISVREGVTAMALFAFAMGIRGTLGRRLGQWFVPSPGALPCSGQTMLRS